MPEITETASLIIRPYEERDLDAMREICAETSSLPLRDWRDSQFLLLTYCDPYVAYTEDCFVAVDEADRPVGYILCASDTRRFCRDFRENIIPRIDRLGLRYSVMARGICAVQEMSAVFAPAHLHIDLTADARRKGTGTALMDTLKAHLAERGIGRVMLTCGSGNKPAVAFYRKNGFRVVFRGFGECVMRADTT